MELTAPVKWLVEVSYLAWQYWYFLIPSLVFAIALDVRIFGALHRTEKTRFGAKTLSASITGVIILGILISMWTAALPLIEGFADHVIGVRSQLRASSSFPSLPSDPGSQEIDHRRSSFSALAA